MGHAYEVIGGRVTNPGATISALTVNTGDSFTLRDVPQESRVRLLQAWASEATVGVLRITSNRLHDPVQGIRLRVTATCKGLLDPEYATRMYPADVLTVALSGGGAETDSGYLLVEYDDLPGSTPRLATLAQVQPMIANVAGMEQNLTSGGTAGDWGGSQAINADFDQWKRDTDYAILGYLCDFNTGAIRIRGADTANLGVGGPASVEPIYTRDYFAKLSYQTGRPMIPIINANNVGGTTIDISTPATAQAVNVTLIVAELSGRVS